MPTVPSWPQRRVFLKLLGMSAAATLVLEVVTTHGCGAAPSPQAPKRVSVPFDQLSGGRRVVVRIGQEAIEVRQIGDEIVARSLVCPHQGCIVQWQEEKRRYKCPCQDAWFDEDGQPVKGPVSEPLHLLPVELSGTTVLVGGVRS